MYLDHTFGLKTFTQRNHFTFWLKYMYLDQTFAQRTGSVKVKSSHPVLYVVHKTMNYICWPDRFGFSGNV